MRFVFPQQSYFLGRGLSSIASRWRLTFCGISVSIVVICKVERIFAWPVLSSTTTLFSLKVTQRSPRTDFGSDIKELKELDSKCPMK